MIPHLLRPALNLHLSSLKQDPAACDLTSYCFQWKRQLGNVVSEGGEVVVLLVGEVHGWDNWNKDMEA